MHQTGKQPMLNQICYSDKTAQHALTKHELSSIVKEKVMMNFKQLLGSTTGLIVCAFAAALGVYMIAYHLRHVALLLPYLVLLACPLMHLLHRGHYHGGGKGGAEKT